MSDDFAYTLTDPDSEGENRVRGKDNFVQDARSGPFYLLTVDAIDAINERFGGTKKTEALAVYTVLMRCESMPKVESSWVAKMSGLSEETVDRYRAEFEKMGPEDWGWPGGRFEDES